MRYLNRQFSGKNESTDVLSFPYRDSDDEHQPSSSSSSSSSLPSSSSSKNSEIDGNAAKGNKKKKKKKKIESQRIASHVLDEASFLDDFDLGDVFICPGVIEKKKKRKKINANVYRHICEY